MAAARGKSRGKSRGRSPRNKPLGLAFDAQVAKRVTELLKTLDMSQSELVHRLGKKFGKSAVSLWVKGRVPSTAAYIELGHLAPWPLNLWFYERAGFQKRKIISVGRELLHQEMAASRPLAGVEDGILVRTVRRSAGRDEELRFRTLVPKSLIRDPIETEVVLVEEASASLEVAPGERIAIDTTGRDSQVLTTFWGRVVLVEMFRPEPNVVGQTYIDPLPNPGFYIGRLRYKRFRTERTDERYKTLSLSWAVTLGPCNDSEDEIVYRFSSLGVQRQGTGLTVGSWNGNVADAPDSPSDWPTYTKREEERMRLEARLAAGVRILGTVLARYWPSDRGEERT